MTAVSQPLVSLITPTRNREHFLALQHAALQQQSYPNIEWLVYDDSEQVSATLSNLDDSFARYFHSPSELSVGLKRNFLVEQARGEIIIHIDDDDYYSPHYVERMVRELQQGHDLVKLSGFFLYSTVYERMGYWDLASEDDYCQIWSAQPLGLARKGPTDAEVYGKTFWGYGFSYAYRREVGLAIGFPDVNFAEDTEFVLQAVEQYKCHAFTDTEGLVLHVLHASNSSRSFPQHSMLPFALQKFFPGVPQGFLQ